MRSAVMRGSLALQALRLCGSSTRFTPCTSCPIRAVNTCWRDTTPITDQFGARLAHQVFDAHASYRAYGAHLRTVCGLYITPAPMIGPVGAPCPACAAILNGRCSGFREQTSSQQPDGRARARRFWSWFRRVKTPSL